jgi:hypothetical protein
MDVGRLFGKLKEHRQKLIALENSEKRTMEERHMEKDKEKSKSSQD